MIAADASERSSPDAALWGKRKKERKKEKQRGGGGGELGPAVRLRGFCSDGDSKL